MSNWWPQPGHFPEVIGLVRHSIKKRAYRSRIRSNLYRRSVYGGFGNPLTQTLNSSGAEDVVEFKRLVDLGEPFGPVGGTAAAALIERQFQLAQQAGDLLPRRHVAQARTGAKGCFVEVVERRPRRDCVSQVQPTTACNAYQRDTGSERIQAINISAATQVSLPTRLEIERSNANQIRLQTSLLRQCIA